MALLAETPRARRQLVTEAGWRPTSFISVLAGTLVAFGAVAMIAAAGGAAGSSLGLDLQGVSTDEWRRAGVAGAAVAAVVVFVAFLFGGYTAGRMSRRAGGRHGVFVFLLSAIFIAGLAALGWAVSDTVDVTESLRDNGVPTDRSTWSDIGLGAAIATGVAMLLGSIAGGIKGDRWHGRLATAVIEHRDAEREAELQRTRADDRDVGDTPVDDSRSIDLRDDGQTASLEEERDREHTTSS